MTEVVSFPFSVLVEKHIWLYSGFLVRCFCGIWNKKDLFNIMHHYATFQTVAITMTALVDKIGCEFHDAIWPSLVLAQIGPNSKVKERRGGGHLTF